MPHSTLGCQRAGSTMTMTSVASNGLVGTSTQPHMHRQYAMNLVAPTTLVKPPPSSVCSSPHRCILASPFTLTTDNFARHVSDDLRDASS